MQPWVIGVVIGACLVAAGCLIAAIWLSSRDKNKKKSPPPPVRATDDEPDDKVTVTDGVRYSDSSAPAAGKNKVTYALGDRVLVRGRTVTVKKGGEVIPGKYTLLSAEGADSFNVRYGGVVREFRHGDHIVLAEGEDLTPVSGSIILR